MQTQPDNPISRLILTHLEKYGPKRCLVLINNSTSIDLNSNAPLQEDVLEMVIKFNRGLLEDPEHLNSAIQEVYFLLKAYGCPFPVAPHWGTIGIYAANLDRVFNWRLPLFPMNAEKNDVDHNSVEGMRYRHVTFSIAILTQFPDIDVYHVLVCC
jgi:hypothetical protein